jgi:superfamily II DNA or RNA helicase
MDIELRDYQSDAIESLRQGIRQGIKNQLLAAPTGAGKTVLAAYLVDECYKKGKRAIFVADRIALINQTSKLFDQYGIPHGVMQAQHWRYRPYENIQIASAQTLARRKFPQTDLIIVDECHSLMKVVLNRIQERDCVTIGLSATPFTKGLGKYYDAVKSVTTTNKLIADGFLSNFEVYAASEPDMTGAKVIAGEWVDSDAAERAMPIVGDCVKEYLKHGNGKKFIAFACNVAHCEALRDQFLASGINVDLYTYKQEDEYRDELVSEFRKPNSIVRGLISVAALSKGFDVPDVEVIIMARPLRSSLSEHIQILGRGLRAHPDKTHCVILDHSGNMKRFWDDMHRFLEHGVDNLCDGTVKKKKEKKDDKKEPRKCPNCHHLHNPAPACPMCGFTYKIKSEIRHEAGELTKLGKKASNSLFEELAYYAVVTRKKDPLAAQKWCQAMHKGMTGVWSNKKIADAKLVVPTMETVNKIKHQNIKWARSRRNK